MSKYSPSISTNNKIKEDFLKNYKSFLYKIEKGKFNQKLNRELLTPIIKKLNDLYDQLENSIGTGQEDIYQVSVDATESLKALIKSFDQDMVTYVDEAAEDFSFSISLWKDVVDGNVTNDSIEEVKKEQKKSHTRIRLEKRLSDLMSIKEQFTANENRLEKDIRLLEKEANELDSLMLSEENERRINELFRKISTLKSKIDSLNVRRENYSACYNLLDLIYSNSSELIQASDFSIEQLNKVKALLNIDKLKSVLSEPEKVVAILKVMEQDIKNISVKTNTIDSKVFSVNSQTTTVNNDALAYKEMLLRKKRDKESANSLIDDIKSEKDILDKEDDNYGII